MAKLELLTIPTPCSASWEAMTGDDTVRHCRECHLDVFDLSAMTREQAERTVADHAGHVCVRFWKRPDGTVITQDCAPLKGEARPCVPRVATPRAHAPASMAMADPVRPSGNPNPPPLPVPGPAPRPILMMGMPP